MEGRKRRLLVILVEGKGKPISKKGKKGESLG